jgi:hypothetical protein
VVFDSLRAMEDSLDMDGVAYIPIGNHASVVDQNINPGKAIKG